MGLRFRGLMRMMMKRERERERGVVDSYTYISPTYSLLIPMRETGKSLRDGQKRCSPSIYDTYL